MESQPINFESLVPKSFKRGRSVDQNRDVGRELKIEGLLEEEGIENDQGSEPLKESEIKDLRSESEKPVQLRRKQTAA